MLSTGKSQEFTSSWDQKEVSTLSSQKQTSSNSKASVIFANRLSSLKPKTYSSISSPWLLQGHQECRIQEWQDSTELTIEADSITRGKPSKEAIRWREHSIYFSRIERLGVLLERYYVPFCLIQVYCCTVEVKSPYLKRSEECRPIQG